MDAKLKALPKISLHDHLDGGLRPQTMVELAEKIGHTLPTNDAVKLGEWFFESADSGSLERYLETFDHTTAVMQTREGLTRVAKEFVLDLHDDGVIYGEVRWAPEQHLRRGLTLDETVEAVQDGLEQGMKDVEAAGGFIRTGQLVTAMRQNNRGMEIAPVCKFEEGDNSRVIPRSCTHSETSPNTTTSVSPSDLENIMSSMIRTPCPRRRARPETMASLMLATPSPSPA